MIDVIGRPQAEARKMLEAEAVECIWEISRPTRDLFPVDESRLFVIRQKPLENGKLQLVLAAKLRKGVS